MAADLLEVFGIRHLFAAKLIPQVIRICGWKRRSDDLGAKGSNWKNTFYVRQQTFVSGRKPWLHPPGVSVFGWVDARKTLGCLVYDFKPKMRPTQRAIPSLSIHPHYGPIHWFVIMLPLIDTWQFNANVCVHLVLKGKQMDVNTSFIASYLFRLMCKFRLFACLSFSFHLAIY